MNFEIRMLTAIRDGHNSITKLSKHLKCSQPTVAKYVKKYIEAKLILRFKNLLFLSETVTILLNNNSKCNNDVTADS